MESLRRRVPFKQDDDEGNETRILDEQEQEQVVEDLRSRNDSSNAQYRLWLQGLLAISALLQLIYLFNPSKDSPLLTLFPPSGPASSPVPLSTLLTLISLVSHGSLVMLSRQQTHLLAQLRLPDGIPFSVLYSISAVGPTLALVLGKPWQTTVWWCFTAAIIFVSQTVLEAIDAGDHSVAELEAIMYRAPGA
ncbi:hypothetical protein BKA70DRAFT_1422182 [Coprinopsis sp. MPI-PUGE-AT-0042]|nr:hypothetical protein BKA70DRAFT_1422182 [Coprinopsis sp. MPI-PUGE-AT-0042]